MQVVRTCAFLLTGKKEQILPFQKALSLSLWKEPLEIVKNFRAFPGGVGIMLQRQRVMEFGVQGMTVVTEWGLKPWFSDFLGSLFLVPTVLPLEHI